MSFKVKMDASKIESVNEDLKKMGIRSKDFQEAAPGVFKILEEDVQYRFKTAPTTVVGGESYGGIIWKPLTATSLKMNPQRVGGQLLNDTGTLRESLTTTSPYSEQIVDKRKIRFGSKVPYAEKNQKSRPFVYWHAYLVEQVATYLLEYITVNKQSKSIIYQPK